MSMCISIRTTRGAWIARLNAGWFLMRMASTAASDEALLRVRGSFGGAVVAIRDIATGLAGTSKVLKTLCVDSHGVV